MGNRRGRASYFQECFRNVSGGGGEQSREWAQPPPGAAGWRSGPGAARARPGGGGGAWAGRRWGAGSKRRVRAWGRPPGAGARGGPGGRPLRADFPPRAQVQRSSCEVPRQPLEGKGSHRRTAGGERRVEGNARARLGEGRPAPLSRAGGWGWGGVEGALLPPSLSPECRARA